MTKYRPKEGVVVTECDGKVIAWSDGVFTGDETLVRYAGLAVSTKAEVLIEGVLEIEAESDTAVGALAAMFIYCPGRTHIMQCPDYVESLLIEAHSFSSSDNPSAISPNVIVRNSNSEADNDSQEGE